MEHEASAQKQAFIAPSVGDSGACMKPPSSEVWHRPDNSPSLHPCG